jgi:3-phytase
LRIALGLDGVRDVQFLGATPLDSDAATPGIQPYQQNDSDTEEILLLPDDTLLISSERDRNNVPWLRRFALDGSLLEDWPIPNAFIPASAPNAQGQNVQNRGVRVNLGFEGVSLAPDESALYAVNEEALAQDGPISTPAAGTNARVLRYALGSGVPVPGRQVVYHTEPIFASPQPPDQFADNGVSALMFIRHLLPQYDFLAMERSFSTGVGNDVNIYGVQVAGATDVSGMASLPVPFMGTTVQKTLLVNMGSLGIIADNLEGIAQGPRLSDGRIALLVISDDNFSDIQTNQFLLFSIAAPEGK